MEVKVGSCRTSALSCSRALGVSVAAFAAVACILWSCSSPPGQAGGDSPQPAPAPAENRIPEKKESPAGLGALVERLGADDWRVREEAEKSIIDSSPESVQALIDAAAKSDDAEIRLRAERLLRHLPGERMFKRAMAFLDVGRIAKGREELDKLAGLSAGTRLEKVRFLLGEIKNMADSFQGFDKGSTAFWTWYTQYAGDDKNNRIFILAVSYNNLYLFLKAEGIESESAFEKSELYYKTIMDEETGRGNRRPASAFAAMLSAAGRAEEGREALKKVENIPLVSWTDYFDVACFHAYASDSASAIKYLKQGLLAADETGYMPAAKQWARESNDFQSLRGNAEFEALVEY